MKPPIFFDKETNYFLLLIFTAITIPWCWVYGISGMGDLQMPIGYYGDGIGIYAQIKAYASGEIFPLLFKFVGTLNAPFTANWNDFPYEDFIYFPAGLLAYFFGLGTGIWLYLLCIQLLAGYSFYFSARVLDLDKSVSAACAVLFALSPFAWRHNIALLPLTMYWHIPLLLVSLFWGMDPTKVKLTQQQGQWLGILAGLFAGFYYPYFLAMFMFLLAIIFAGALYRKEKQHAFRIAAIAAAAVAGFLLFNADTLLFAFLHGKGGAVVRQLDDLIVGGLRLSDLFAAHRPGENTYVGVVALYGLGTLVVMGTIRLAARSFDRINNFYWIALGIFSFAVVGGVNYLVGARLGFVLLRGTNRYSIMLMAIGLLVVASMISSIKRKWLVSFFASAIVMIGLYDQLPAPISLDAKNYAIARVAEDKAVAASLENLGEDAMVFQLPVHAFPESGPVKAMADYDLFRPWLWTKKIHFSYGTMKGRGNEDWQHLLINNPVERILDDLNRYGFSALLINRSAYKDGASELKEKLTVLGYEIFINQPSYYGFRLKPIAKPELPHIDQYIVTYKKGFYEQEWDVDKSFRWADSDAFFKIGENWAYAEKMSSAESGKYQISFGVQSLGDRSVWLEFGSSKMLVSAPGDKTAQVKFEIDPESLQEKFHIYSDTPSVLAGNGDPRKLAFQVINLKIEVVK